jgi:RHS repeat-associated protein
VGNEVLYAGYRYDPETSLYQLRYRQYDPSTGRFLQRDPSGYNGTMNAYGYAGGNPVTTSDPMGLAATGENAVMPSAQYDSVFAFFRERELCEALKAGDPRAWPELQDLNRQTMPNMSPPPEGPSIRAPIDGEVSEPMHKPGMKDFLWSLAVCFPGFGTVVAVAGGAIQDDYAAEIDRGYESGDAALRVGYKYAPFPMLTWLYTAEEMRRGERLVGVGATEPLQWYDYGTRISALVVNSISTRFYRSYFARSTGPNAPVNTTRVYRAVSEAEYKSMKTGQFTQGPNSLEGKWFSDSLEGAKLHGDFLHGPGNYRIIEADVPNNAPSLFQQPNLDGRGPARYLDLQDLNGVKPRPTNGG